MENAELYNTILIIAGALIAALLFIVYKLGINLRDMLPPSFVPLIPVMLNTLTELAQQTETLTDDEIVEKLRELLEAKPITPPAE